MLLALDNLHMKKITSLSAIAASAACAVFLGVISINTASAQFGFSTGFESSEGYLPGTLSGSPSNPAPLNPSDIWDTSDPSTNPTPGITGEFIGQADSVINIAGNYSGAIGGRGIVVPGAQSVNLFRDFSVTGVGGFFAFDVDFGITASSLTYPGLDTFGWSLVNTANVEVFALTFVSAGATNLDVFSSYNGAAATDSFQSLTRGNSYHLSVFVNDVGNVSVNISGTPITVQPGLLVGSSIKRVAATQFVTGGTVNGQGAYTDAGSNQMIFDNYSAVPEPSTVGLAIIAGLGGAVVMFRRRNKTA